MSFIHEYYGEKGSRILYAANLCMKAIEKSGLSQSEALEVPSCLASIIERSNQLSANKAPFSPKYLKIMADGRCGLEIIDLETPDD